MRVLLISPSISNIGGVEVFTQNLSKGLSEKGVEVKILSSEALPMIPVQGLKNASFAMSGAVAGLARHGERYDIAHAQNLPSVLPAKAHAARARVLTIHGVYAEQIGMLHGKTLEGMVFWAEKKIMNSVDAIAAISKQVAEYYRTLGFEAEYIPNGIDLKGLPTKALRYHPFQIAYIGRLSKEKGADVLIRAFKELPPRVDAKLVIVGSGPEEGALRKVAAGCDRVEFAGPKDHDTALQIMNGSDIFVQPSRMEGLGIAVIEAMALGRPVIAAAVGGIRELVEDRSTGLLFDPEDPSSLASSIVRLGDDRELGRRMAENARARVFAEYSLEMMTERYLRLYQRCL